MTTKLNLSPDLRILKMKITHSVSPFSVKVVASDNVKYVLSYTTAEDVMVCRGAWDARDYNPSNMNIPSETVCACVDFIL